MFRSLKHILEMIRFSHTLFALPFAMLAAVMAWATPLPDGRDVQFRWRHLAGILLCMVFARSVAMAFNRLADRKIDAENPRTASRHLPAGLLSVRSVVIFTVLSAVGFVISTTLFLPNPWPLLCSLPVLLWLCGYSYAKRFTSLAHFWLGIALMLSPIAAWVALRGQVLTAFPMDIIPPTLLGAAVLLWVAGFDIIYACQDADFDATANLHSIPASIGVANALRFAAGCHAAMVVALALIPWCAPELQLGWIYGSGILGVALLLAVEHWLVRPEDLSQVNLAFFHVNTVVSLGLFVVGTLDLLT